MRRVLNLNHFAGRLVASSIFFLIALPVLLVLVGRVFPAINTWNLILASVGMGGIILATLVVLIVLEQVQDTHFTRSYQRQRMKKLPIGDGWYECQYCGNRQVRAEDRLCIICGKELE